MPEWTHPSGGRFRATGTETRAAARIIVCQRRNLVLLGTAIAAIGHTGMASLPPEITELSGWAQAASSLFLLAFGLSLYADMGVPASIADSPCNPQRRNFEPHYTARTGPALAAVLVMQATTGADDSLGLTLNVALVLTALPLIALAASLPTHPNVAALLVNVARLGAGAIALIDLYWASQVAAQHTIEASAVALTAIGLILTAFGASPTAEAQAYRTTPSRGGTEIPRAA